MRFLLFLLATVAFAQDNSITLGVGSKFDTGAKSFSQSYDALIRYHRFGFTDQLSADRSSFAMTSRGYMATHIFIFEGIRRADVKLHPWYLQPGMGIDDKLWHDHFFATIYPEMHLKTGQVGFGYGTQHYFGMGHNVSLRLSYSHTKLDTAKGPSLVQNQVSLGMSYTLHFKR